MNMKKKTTVNSLVGTVLVLAAFAVFASSPAKTISIGPDGVKCTLGKDGTPVTCTWG
jgi:hypothetical protein